MQEEGKTRRRRWPLYLLLSLVPLYFITMAQVRSLVSRQIHAVQGKMLPDFQLRDRQGELWNKERLAGKKVLLNFFRSHCSNCLAEKPVLRELFRQSDASQLQVLGVMMDAVEEYEPEVTEATLLQLACPYPVLMADQAFVDQFHGVGWAHVTPVSYIADAKGRITHALRGKQSLSTLQQATR